MATGVGRRQFISALGGTVVAWPLAARAQQTSRMRRIGVLMGQAESDPEGQARVAAFRLGLQELRWTEGNNVHTDIRWGAGDATRIKTFVAELVNLTPDVILGVNTPVVRALKQATQTIPIVFAALSDPIGDGIVTSLSKPGGNITGFSGFDPAIAGKWLQLLKEISPGIVRVAVIFNPDTAPDSIFWPALEAAAPLVGVTLIRATVRDPAAIESAIAAVASTPGGGLVVMPDIFTALHRAVIIASAARHRLPAVYPFRYHIVDGGLISYGPDYIEQFRRAASYIDRILKGEKPSDLPVQAPTKFEFVINRKTAKALAIDIPPLMLANADEVIE
jgi:putative tryptophan/tyrosine transport system substrate-binding protein